MISGFLITLLSYRTDEHTVSILKREVEDFFLLFLQQIEDATCFLIHYNAHYNFYFISLSSPSLQIYVCLYLSRLLLEDFCAPKRSTLIIVRIKSTW